MAIRRKNEGEERGTMLKDAKIRLFGNYRFINVGSISPATDELGKIKEYSHKLPRGVRGNLHAGGPFCRFKLPAAPTLAGVYAITSAKELKYLGECESLDDRFGPGGYGHIAARNCHYDGQSTNCKVNALILKSVKSGERIDVWFFNTSQRKAIEAELLASHNPSWNGNRRGRVARKPTPRGRRREPVPSADDFRLALREKLRIAHRTNQSSLRVRSRDLHHEVGGYPGPNQRMPTCCGVMRTEMRKGDKVISEPPSGTGASLVIEYRIPRP